MSFQATNGLYFSVGLTTQSQLEGMSSRLSCKRTCDTTVMSVIEQMILLVIVYFSYCSASSIVEDSSNDLVYNNQFAVNIPNASEVLVQLIAEKHGFRSLGQVITHAKHIETAVLEFPSFVFKWGKSCAQTGALSEWVFFVFFYI